MSNKPNILFIVIDDLGNYIGPYGDVYADTPNLNKFAKTSTTFINHHVQVPVCGASRTSMLFGRRANKTGVYDFEPFRNRKSNGMKTLPEELRAIGYSTHSIGKVMDHAQWGRDDEIKTVPEKCDGNPKTKCSWDTIYSYKNFVHDANKCEPNVKTNKYAYKVPGDDSNVEDQCLTNNATQLIDSLTGKPWFIAVGLRKPHLPWFCTVDDYAKFAGKSFVSQKTITAKNLHGFLSRPNDEINTQYEGYNNHRTVTAPEAYYACVRQTDRMVGKLISKVSDYDNTVIIVWGDNGFHLASPDGMVGKKTLFRHSTATPLIIHWPNYFDKGEKVMVPVESIDILPTIAEITGININNDWDGKTLTILSNRTWAQSTYRLYGAGGNGIAYNGQNPYETYIKFSGGAALKLKYDANIVTETPVRIDQIPASPAEYTFSPSQSPTQTESPTLTETPTQTEYPTQTETPTLSSIGSDMSSSNGSAPNTMTVVISIAGIILVFVAMFFRRCWSIRNAERKSSIIM